MNEINKQPKPGERGTASEIDKRAEELRKEVQQELKHLEESLKTMPRGVRIPMSNPDK